MYCINCGSKIYERSYFCNECGSVVLKNIIPDVRNNDENAIGVLIQYTQNKMYYTAYRFVKNQGIAEDIVQESYIQALKNLDSLKEDDKFISWITTILINRCKSYLAVKKNTEFTDFSSLDDSEDELNFEENIENERIDFIPEKNFNYDQLKEGLNTVLNDLPDNQRMAIILYYLDEFKIKDIAEILDVPQGTVKSLLNYGRKAIKSKIEELRKQNKSFYSVVPVPFLIWMLKEQSKTVNVSAMMKESVLKGAGISRLTPPPINSIQATQGVAIKGAVTTTVKTISTKAIIGIVATVVGVGSASGYALSQTVFNQNDQEQVESSSPDNQPSYQGAPIESIEDAIDNFDFSPIALNGDTFIINDDNLVYDSLDDEVYEDSGNNYYIASVDGKFGLLSSENEWVVEPEIDVLTYYPERNLFSGTSGTVENHDGFDKGVPDQYGIYHAIYAGVGGSNIPQLEIKTEDGGDSLSAYIITIDSNDGEIIEKPYTSESFFSWDPNGMAWSKYEDKWCLINPDGKVFGPYDLEETPSFESNLLMPYEDGKQDNFFINFVFPFHSMFYSLENDQYRIYNQDASKGSEQLYDKVEVLSNSWIKANRKNKTVYIDENLKEYTFENCQNVSEPLQNRSYAKIDGTWKYIELRD